MNEKEYKYIGIIAVNDELIHIGKDKDYLYSGIITNAGFIEDDEYKIDHDISLGQNVQDFIEFLEEE